jgi:hypothetical protein
MAASCGELNKNEGATVHSRARRVKQERGVVMSLQRRMQLDASAMVTIKSVGGRNLGPRR